MQKLIVERPRLGSRLRNLKSGERLTADDVRSAIDAADDYDGGPARASSGRRNKGLNENLAPLRRYLHRQIGRPWNKVFSEIRKNLDTRSAIGLHVMQHLYQFIDVQTLLSDGAVYSIRGYRCELRPVEGLYVHPATGLIRFIKPKPRAHRNWWAPPPDAKPDFVELSRMSAYEKLNGLWFRTEYTNGANGAKVLVSKRQCDSKTVRRIERGELGTVVPRPHWGGWPPVAIPHQLRQ